MARLVMKFGGTSVANVDRIRNVARHVKREVDAGHSVAVVVSAMSGKTNELVALCREAAAGPVYDPAEYDAVVASGELVTAGLLAIVLKDMGLAARSWQGWQIPLTTDDAHSAARIENIDGAKIVDGFKRGEIAVVAGFQGVDEDGDITTLGRGGSDTSAVAVAAAIGAAACEIFTDVDGVYTTDPGVCPSARKIDRITYEEMLELASLGAKVLQIRSVEIAMKYNVPLHVRSTFSDAQGTWVTGEESALEDVSVTGVAADKNEARVLLVGVLDQPGVVAGIFGAIAEKNISVDMIIQSPSAASSAQAAGEVRADVTFTLTKTDLPRVRPFIDELALRIGAREVRYDEDVVKVSIVGLGMRSHAGVAARMFAILAKEGINIQAISTSEIKISCLVASKYAELAVRALHDGFELGKGAAT